MLHVAAHGTHRHDSPLFSSLRLADGPLYAYELDPDQGMPACVTLSACEAGLATLRPGDEGLGLTHVLLHLGVASVTAGVARVRDDVAAATMQRVHEEMAAGATSAEALALAQAEGREAAGARAVRDLRLRLVRTEDAEVSGSARRRPSPAPGRCASPGQGHPHPRPASRWPGLRRAGA